MTRILAFVLALVAAGVAVYVLTVRDRSALREVAPPLDEIDGASRAALERALEEADR